MTMNATLPGALRTATPVFADEVAAFIAANDFDRPTLVVSRARVETQYDALKAGLGRAKVHFAVKANPAPQIIRTLVKKGSGFDCASRGEIELCLAQGARPENISFGNTIKRASDIAFAHGVGVDIFAADSEAELEKIATHAPGARVYLRLIVENSMADWPLSRKFGCAPSALSMLAPRPRSPSTGTRFWTRSRRFGTLPVPQATTCSFSTWAAVSRPSMVNPSRPPVPMPLPSFGRSRHALAMCPKSWRSRAAAWWPKRDTSPPR